MTEQPSSAQGTAGAQLKQLLADKVKLGVGGAATLAGQQAGVLAQAVRQAGEEFRQQGQDNQGKVADKVAQPVQRLSASFSTYDSQALELDPKQVRPQLTSQFQKAKTQVSEQVSNQVTSRTAQAGQGVTALTAALGQVGQQLRAQGQQTPALVVDALAERVQPVSGYLSSADPSKMRSDITGLGRQARVRLSSAAGAVDSRRQSVAGRGAQVVKQTGSGFKQSPVLPAVGAVVAAVALAARRGSKSSSTPTISTPTPRPTPAEPAVGDTAAPVPGVDDLSRAQLLQRAEAAGIATEPNMTKAQLRDALGLS